MKYNSVAECYGLQDGVLSVRGEQFYCGWHTWLSPRGEAEHRGGGGRRETRMRSADDRKAGRRARGRRRAICATRYLAKCNGKLKHQILGIIPYMLQPL